MLAGAADAFIRSSFGVLLYFEFMCKGRFPRIIPSGCPAYANAVGKRNNANTQKRIFEGGIIVLFFVRKWRIK